MEDIVTLAEQEQDQENLDLEGIETSYGEEADLHKHLSKCKKNPGHHQFIPIDKFNVEHLPPGCHDNEIVDLVRAQADLTVCVSVKYVSDGRPETDPNSQKPYPFSNKRGCNDQRYGTGWIDSILKYLPELEDARGETCKCKECLNSPTPKIQFAHIYIYTAAHVVYDYLEADHTTCHLFFDRGNKTQTCSGVVTLTEPSYVFGDINTDVCQLIYTTHDLALADKLEGMVDRHVLLTYIVYIKYFSSMSEKLDSLHEDDSLRDSANSIAMQMKYFKRGLNVLFPACYTALNYCVPQEMSTMLSYIETMFHLRYHCALCTINTYIGADKQTDIENSSDFFNECVNHCLEIIKGAKGIVDTLVSDCELDSDTRFIKDQTDSYIRYISEQVNNIKTKPYTLKLLSFSENFRCVIEKSAQINAHFLNLLCDRNIESDNCIHDSQQPLLAFTCKFMEEIRHICSLPMKSKKHLDIDSVKHSSQPQVGSVDDSLRTLTIIVSHPHGCSKQVSIGHYTKQDVESDPSSKLAYTTATCPGSSGAHVCMMERSHLCQYVHVGKSQRNTKLNYSGSLWDIPLD